MGLPELTAEPGWQTVDFISDLHLQASEPATFHAWLQYMQSSTADALFILGDLFEVWVGDDVLQNQGFEGQCAEVIKQASARFPIFIMHGNRDFLMASACMTACNASLLSDPAVLTFSGQRWMLSHGDALCLADTAYMQFRQTVRSSEWQETFLAKPLHERQTIARSIRQKSEVRKQTVAHFADVDANAARQLLQQAESLTMIHGHTHKPATHNLGSGMQRVVLSDWDAAAMPPRAEVLRLSAQGLQRTSFL